MIGHKIHILSIIALFSELMHAEYHHKAQYFIEVPKNQTVTEGDAILLRCQVGNRQGVVQWTRNGFAMGKILSFIQLPKSKQFKTKKIEQTYVSRLAKTF